MNDNTYNGWTNWETWRVNLEVFDGWTPDYPVSPEDCEEIAQQTYLADIDPSSLGGSLITTTLESVNWYEIADHLNN